MDVKPSTLAAVKPNSGYMLGVAGQEFSGSQEYLATSTSHQWQYNQQQMAANPTTNPYLAHQIPRGYGINGEGRDITSEEFQEGEEGGEGMDPMKGREGIGQYDSDMISQTGPIRGYPRSDGFVWRPY